MSAADEIEAAKIERITDDLREIPHACQSGYAGSRVKMHGLSYMVV